MALFKIDGTTVKKITAKDLDLEKNLQALFESNLDELLNITFLAHEYPTSFGGRIDSLGIDRDGSPCIIEYKRGQNENVINQGLSYLYWLLDHKADFEKICQQKNYNGSIDWDSPRVICVAESYNKFDLDTVSILPINVELWRYRIYDQNLLLLESENFKKVRISTTGIIKKNKQEKQVLQKSYTVDDRLSKIGEDLKLLFLKLRERILSIDEEIKEEPKKLYIAYKLTTNFVDVAILAKPHYIKLWLNVKSGQLSDPQGLARDMTKPKPTGHWGNGDYEVKIDDDNNLDAVMALIKQSYDLNK